MPTTPHAEHQEEKAPFLHTHSVCHHLTTTPLGHLLHMLRPPNTHSVLPTLYLHGLQSHLTALSTRNGKSLDLAPDGQSLLAQIDTEHLINAENTRHTSPLHPREP